MANKLDFNEGVFNLTNITEYPNSFKRQGAFPLERFSVFSTFDALKDYAINNPIAYVGQLLVLVNDDNTATTYVIQSDAKDDTVVTEVGKATAADGNSIVLDGETLSLNDFGKKYYEYDSEVGSYKTTATEGWKDGLEPAIVGGKLVWREQNTSTISGLTTQVETNKSSINELNTKVDDVKTALNTKADKATTLDGYGITDAYTKTETNAEIDKAVAGLGTVFELKATVSQETFNGWGGSVATASTELNVTLAKGDVVLVSLAGDTVDNNTNVEYVVVGKTVEGAETLVFELLGDPSGVTKLNSELTEVRANIKTIDGKLIDYNTRIDDNKSAIDDTVARIQPIEADIVNKADKATTLAGYGIGDAYTKDEVDTKINTAKTTLEGTIETTKTILEASIKTVSDDLDDLETTVTDHITTYSNNKTVTDEAIATNKTNIATNTSKITSIETTLAKKFDTPAEKTVDGFGLTDVYTKGEVDAAVNAAKSSTTELETKVDKNASDISSTNTALASTNAEVATLKTTVGDTTDGLVKDVADNKKSIATNSTEIASIKTTLSNKVDTSTYTTAIDDINTAVAKKADATDLETLTGSVYTKNEVDVKISAIDDELAKKLVAGDAMVFKGLLGTGGISTLPTESVNNGDTYKVTTAGTYASQSAQVGDMFIAVVPEGSSGTITWVLVPSGDDGNVYHTEDGLTAKGVVIATDGKTIETLATGKANQILRLVNGNPTWSDETPETAITSNDGSISVNDHDIKVAKVNCSLLTQTVDDYLIFDCGSSTVNI